MDIRTKLVFALVGVALGSMLALGIVMYNRADENLREIRLQELNGLAESMKGGLEQIASGWEDRVSLIASRTQLRLSLQEYNRSPATPTQVRIDRILNDALTAVAVVEALAVYDMEDRRVASATRGGEPLAQEERRFTFPASEGAFYQGVSITPNGDLRVGYAAPLLLEGLQVGVLDVQLNAQALLDLTQRRVGLAESGQAMIVLRDQEGVARILHREEEEEPQHWHEAEPRGRGDPVGLALAGDVGTHSEGITDEDGEDLWVAIRYLPETEWGLIVRLDAEEGRKPVMAFKDELMDVAMALGAFAMVIGTILGLHFAKPIHDLAQVADRIREGTLSARAKEGGGDEVAFLARTFNQMAEEMEERVTLLREFQRFFDSSLDMLCIASTDGFFKRINPAFERILGWTNQELLGQSFMEFVHPKDKQKTIDVIQELAKGIPAVSFENRYQCADGTFRLLVWTSRPDPETGLLYAIARDITDTKERRQKAKEEIQDLRARLHEVEAKLRGQD